MDYNPSLPPPVPRQTRQSARRRSLQTSTLQTPVQGIPPPRTPDANRVPPASPEVISSLIHSFSVVSSPATATHFDPQDQHDSQPTSPNPAGGSFGVTYGISSGSNNGAGGPPASSANEPEEDPDLDELAACPPVIKTAKPPSGFSPLTAPRSPARESVSGLKSLLGKSSRPSSKGSQSQADDTQSIGNLSIERASAPPSSGSGTHELRKQRSHDSWGRKTSGRNSKGLMYMSSKERLREKESEKRASFGAVGGHSVGQHHSHHSKPDPLAETTISEEPGETTPHRFERASSSSATATTTLVAGHTTSETSSPRPIPTRDSSLRKTGSNARRSSARASRSKRDSEHEVIHEGEEYGNSYNSNNSLNNYNHLHNNHHNSISSSRKGNGNGNRRESSTGPRRRHHSTPSGEISRHQAEDIMREMPEPKHSSTMSRQLFEGTYFDSRDDDVDDGAPFPAVAQGRRRESSKDRRRISSHNHHLGATSASESGGNYHSDGQLGGNDSGSGGRKGVTLKLKRSSSKLKRSSNPNTPLASPRDPKHNSSNLNRMSLSPEPTVTYERPPSADSIDDAVESYLCSPRLSQKIRHPQTGRVISFSEVGDSEGSAVFCCVGMGLTRYITAFYDELALTLKLRLITPDRPGVGDSEAYADGTATPLSWPDDVYAICQALKITKFSILAHSAGAIYALATALRMPQHIRGRIHLLAPWIPPSQMNVFGTSQTLPPTNAIPTSQRILRALPTPILKAANSSFMSATSSSITSSLPKTPRSRGKRKSAAARNSSHSTPASNGDAVPSGRDTPTLARSASPGNNKENTHGLLQTPDPTSDMDRFKPSHTTLHPGGIGSNPASPLNQNPPTPLSEDDHLLSYALAQERQTQYDTRLTTSIWDLATTGANPAVDLLVCLERRHAIGFRYVDITRPVVIHHGSRDTRVPVENVRWLGKTMRRCEVRVLEGEGHGLMASATVMGGVLMEISKEWEDWVRVTGRGRMGTVRG